MLRPHRRVRTGRGDTEPDGASVPAGGDPHTRFNPPRVCPPVTVTRASEGTRRRQPSQNQPAGLGRKSAGSTPKECGRRRISLLASWWASNKGWTRSGLSVSWHVPSLLPRMRDAKRERGQPEPEHMQPTSRL